MIWIKFNHLLSENLQSMQNRKISVVSRDIYQTLGTQAHWMIVSMKDYDDLHFTERRETNI